MQAPKPNDPVGTGTAPASKKKPTPLWNKLLTIGVLLGVAVFAVSLLPRGYSQDISLIGKGDRIVVLYQEPFTVDGQDNVDTMNAIRDEYDGKVKFVLADKKVEQGKKFSEMYDINSTAFVFFAPTGEKIGVLYGGQDAEAMRKSINQLFGF